MSPPESGKPARCDQHPAGPFRTETKTATKPLHLDSEATAPVKPQRTVFTCPECAAACTIDGVDTARHSDACTTGTGSRAVAVADLLWFLDHPDAPHRYRAPQLAEYGELHALGLDPATGTWRVRVARHRDGLQRTLCQGRGAVVTVIDVVELRRVA